MAQPKRHHFIPQMILRHFSDTDGQLWFWRREFELGDIRKTAPLNLFVEKDLYAIINSDGTKDVAFEEFLAELDGSGDQFIRQLIEIVRNGRVPNLEDSAWDFWVHFLYYQVKRTPGYLNEISERVGFRNQIRAAVDEMKAVGAAAGKTDGHDELEDQLYDNAIVSVQGQAPGEKFLTLFQNLGIVIYRITDMRISYIIGDVPGASAHIRKRNAFNGEKTFFLPLTHDIAVGLLASPKAVEVVNVNREQVRRMNLATASRSKVIAGRSHRQLSSIAKSAPYTGVTKSSDAGNTSPYSDRDQRREKNVTRRDG